MVTLLILPASRPLPKSGPFPPPTLLGFLGTTGLSATPHGPACPSRASGWSSRTTAGVSRVALTSSCVVPSPLPRQDRRRGSWVIPLCAATVAFPFKGGGSAPAKPVFGACSAFTAWLCDTKSQAFVTARSLAESLNDPLSFKAPTRLLPPRSLELLPARMTKLPGGIRTHWKSTPLHGARPERAQ